MAIEERPAAKPATKEINLSGDSRPSTAAVNRALGRSTADVAARVNEILAASKPAVAAVPPKPAEPAPAASVEEPAATETAAETVAAPAEQAAADTGRAPSQERMLADVRARERAFEQKRETHRREREQFESYKQRTEREVQAAREQLALAQQDPFAWLERFAGIRRDAFGALPGGPKGVETNVELAKRDAAIHELRQELQAMREQGTQRQQTEVREQELRAFETQARSGTQRWPLAAKWSAEKLRNRGWEIASGEWQKSQVALSNEEVLDRIEEELSEIASLRAPKVAAKPKATETTPTENPGHQPTLTARGQSSSAPSQPSTLRMSQRDRIARTVAVIEQQRAEQARK